MNEGVTAFLLKGRKTQMNKAYSNSGGTRMDRAAWSGVRQEG